MNTVDPDLDSFNVVKIIDGLFIGDDLGAQDEEFVSANKIRFFINCSAKESPCFFDPMEADYLCLDWMNSDQQVTPLSPSGPWSF